MKILLNAAKYDYGKKNQGLGFEYYNFYQTFKKLKFDVLLFDFISEEVNSSKEGMNRNFLKIVVKYKPDIIFSIFHPGHFEKETLLKIQSMPLKSVIWMTDDEWLWESFGKFSCHDFHYVITTDTNSVKKYASVGYKNVIISQWGANTDHLKKLNVKKDVDVSFIGFINPWREFLVNFLKRNGINILCYGTGWDNGRLSLKEMNKLFNRSKIVLNISNSVQYDVDYLLSLQLRWNRNFSFKQNMFYISPQLNTLLSGKRIDQIKARVFEVPAAGSFLLAHNVNGIEQYYQIGKEIEIYKDKTDLVKKIRLYLSNEAERERIAKLGYSKTIQKYTYPKILSKVLNSII